MFGWQNIQERQPVISSRSANTNLLSIIPFADDTTTTTVLPTDREITAYSTSCIQDVTKSIQHTVSEAILTSNHNVCAHYFPVMRLNNVTSLIWKLQCS